MLGWTPPASAGSDLIDSRRRHQHPRRRRRSRRSIAAADRTGRPGRADTSKSTLGSTGSAPFPRRWSLWLRHCETRVIASRWPVCSPHFADAGADSGFTITQHTRFLEAVAVHPHRRAARAAAHLGQRRGARAPGDASRPRAGRDRVLRLSAGARAGVAPAGHARVLSVAQLRTRRAGRNGRIRADVACRDAAPDRDRDHGLRAGSAACAVQLRAPGDPRPPMPDRRAS